MLASRLVAADEVSGPIRGFQPDVSFHDYSLLSGSAELARRLLSPLHAARLLEKLRRSGQGLREQPIDLAQEHFAAYVPAEMPEQGYALLVFVPPWQAASMPTGWAEVLDRHGTIYVSAANSGNGESILDRREPLALLGAQNIMRRYRIDPARVYIGGFSGGSRVALRIALGYPDVFRGALLIAGSDPIGDAEAPLPEADLLRQFQTTRIVFLTGTNDSVNAEWDAGSARSLRQWCVFDLDTDNMSGAGHEVPGPADLNRALRALAGHRQIEPQKLAACRARIETEMSSQLRQLTELLASDKPSRAEALLERIDSRFGGLAAAQSLEIARQLESGRRPKGVLSP